jgi:hypothetical protein
MKQLFIDCDGVPADFDTAARELFGQDSREAEESLGTPEFWSRIIGHGSFYRNLPLLPDATRWTSNAVRIPNATLVSQYPAKEYPDAETRRAPHAIPDGTRAELGDVRKGQSNFPIFSHCSQSRLILRASIEESTDNLILATLALKEDTIPKPNGLGMVMRPDDIERSSNDIEQCSKMIEDCSHRVRGST